MSQNTKKALQTIFFALVGLGLMWWVLHDTNWPKLWQILLNAKIIWLLFGLALNTLSNVVRGARWNMLLEPLGYKPRLMVSWFAVQIGYAANLIFPRLGEVSRCAVLQQYEDIPVDKSLGTVVTERLADMVVLLLIVPLALLLDYGVLVKFLQQLNWGSLNHLAMLLIVAITAGTIMLAAAVYIFKRYKKNVIVVKVNKFIFGFMSGISSIRKIKRPWLFIVHTVFMWVLYWLTSYVIFRCFDFSEHLTLVCALVLLATGTFGFVMPVQGGIGAYEFIVIMTLKLYGLEYEQSRAYALLNHFGTIFAQALIGILAMAVLARFYRVKATPIIL